MVNHKKMREEFEAWMEQRFGVNIEKVRSECGSLLFDAWQASRAMLVIELPADDLSLERSNGIDECRDAIAAAGIRTT